jgi:hypothetical protein
LVIKWGLDPVPVPGSLNINETKYQFPCSNMKLCQHYDSVVLVKSAITARDLSMFGKTDLSE